MAQRNFAFSLTGNQNQASTTMENCRTDWLMIPCATNLGRTTACVDRICGGTFNAEPNQVTPATVSSAVRPFRLVYHTNAVEVNQQSNDVGNRGFCLNFIQQPCTIRLSK